MTKILKNLFKSQSKLFIFFLEVVEISRAIRSTKIEINLDNRDSGGANTLKRKYLERTQEILNEARAFYVRFFLSHPEKFEEKVLYFSEKRQEWRERKLNSKELLTKMRRKAPAFRHGDIRR